MTRAKGVFKKRVNKGNRYYKTVPKLPNEASTSRPSSTVPLSASKTKLRTSGNKFDDFEASSQNLIVSVDVLKAMFQKVACKQCGNSVVLDQNVKDQNGLVSRLSVSCLLCNNEELFWTSEANLKNASMFDTNIRFFYGLRCIGKGLEAGKMLCAIMNLPPPSTARSKYTDITSKAIKVISEKSMVYATKVAIEENEKGIEEHEEKTDLSVAYDGSWQKRGFRSKNGFATVTSVDTGKVMDIEVLTKFCSGCTKATDEDKQIAHASSCKKNYEGSSGGMETAAAVSIFGRSHVKRGVQYVNFLGDGDSKAFERVKESRPYEGKEIKKLECVGHVMKRMGTRLRNLKSKMGSTPLSDGKSIKGAGRLTDKIIDELQGYYGKAIRDNTDNLESMKKAVWATYFHRLATDENPCHQLCPAPPNTWCKYRIAESNNENYKHKHSIPEPIMTVIKPIYKALSHPDLLRKCLHGKTQNVNESFNNVVWTRIPKNVFVGLDTLELGIRDAVLVFNDGNIGRIRVLQELGVCDLGTHTITALRKFDDIRLRQAERTAEAMTKESRVKKRRQLLGEEVEDDDQYVPGGF